MEANTPVRQVLSTKGSRIHSIAPDASVFDALQTMARHDVGALVVLDEGRVAGMFSERDYARKVILHGKASRDTAVRDIMSEQVVTVTPALTMEACMRLMTERRVRHLPVIDDGALIGIISIGDVVKAVMEEQRFLIDQLESYIRGGV